MKNKTWRSCHSPRFPYLSFLLSHRLFRSSPAMNHEALRGQPFYGQASISINHAYVLVWVHFMVDSSVSCSFVMYWCWACDRYTRTNSLLLHLVDLVTSVLTNVFTFLTFPYEKSFGIVFSGQKSENVLWPLCHRILSWFMVFLRKRGVHLQGDIHSWRIILSLWQGCKCCLFQLMNSSR